jgi:hypothetical protein
VTFVAKFTNVVEVEPVPPLAIGKVPVTPVVKGNPVAFARLPAVVSKVPEAPGRVNDTVTASTGANVVLPLVDPLNTTVPIFFL